MELNRGNLQLLGTAFSGLFRGGLGMAPPQYLEVATVVPSSTGKNEYGWLNQIRGMREWLGDRVLNQITQSDYVIKNKDWEDTIEVERNDIEDDNLGQYNMLFTEMGRATAAHPNELVYGLLKAGFSTPCYDGQYYFDTDHPVLDAAGNVTSVANTDGGSGTPWFLIDTSRVMKPIIFQDRKKPQFVAKDNLNDENAFWRKKFVYGVDARYNVGFGFWQFAWGSKQTLNAANYATAMAALGSMKGDYGRPLGLLTGEAPLLVFPPSLESNARTLIINENDAAGATNPWKGSARLFKTAWLA
ncbi:Mu-like prophage major head subunit gpT family protein [Sphingobium ummariense]|uniref:Head protein n=1 Tax=Sphingobium ummariense RL-3 TaxID=1346791 RepID=T0K5N0_9SPHN|nr:Mu-like prophage major head subunit gpT family protein [Sphingobium ummariense]EQB31979.1 head protein [Sphingobium ummariense RL-3]